MTGKLVGKVGIVTGAGRGTGKSFALGLAREGAKVAVVVRKHVDEAETVAKEIERLGSEAIAIKADVSKISDIEAMVKKTVERFGKIDILVNNAGIYPLMPFLETTENGYDSIMDINVKGTFFCVQYVARHMVDKGIKGRIVNISSSQGIIGTPMNTTVYSASKGGIIALTRALAGELAPHGIGVNAVALGMTKTEGVNESGVGEQLEAFLVPMTAAKRMAAPEDYVGIVNWLASNESGFAVGSCFVVDGGLSTVMLMPSIG